MSLAAPGPKETTATLYIMAKYPPPNKLNNQLGQNQAVPTRQGGGEAGTNCRGPITLMMFLFLSMVSLFVDYTN